MKRRSLWILVAVVLLGYALRVYRLDWVSLRGDESFTVLFSAQPWPDLVEGMRTVEPNPPLSYLALRGAMVLFGQSDLATRYVSALWGVVAVALLYQVGRSLFRRREVGLAVGLLAALIVAVNPYQIWHSQDVRNYTLWPALSLASLWFLLRAVRDPQHRRSDWIGYTVTALLSLYTHYYDIFILVFENVFVLLWYRKDRQVLKPWLVAQGVLAALYLPWLLFGTTRPLTYAAGLEEMPGLLEMVRRSLSTIAWGETLPGELGGAFLPAVGLLLIAGGWFAFRRDRSSAFGTPSGRRPSAFGTPAGRKSSAVGEDRRALAFLLLYLAVPILCVWVLIQWRPFFRERYLNGIAPGLYLGLALGVVALTRLRRGRALATAVGLAVVLVPAGLALGHYYYDPAYAKSPDWRGLALYLERQAGAEDVVVQNDPDPTLAYYYRGPAPRVVLPHRSAVDRAGDLKVNREATGEALRQLLAEHRRLWLIPNRSSWDPEGFVEGWLERRGRRVDEGQVGSFRVIAYEEQEGPLPSIQQPMTARFGEGVELAGYDLEADPGCKMQEAGEGRWLIAEPRSCVLHLTLYWRAVGPLPEDVAYTVFTHLVDNDGQIQAQKDNQPQEGGFPTAEWLPGDAIADEYRLALSPEAAAGEYRLEVGMYRPEDGERLPAYDAEGRRWPGDAVRLEPAGDEKP